MRERLALILALLALGVAGCGGDDEDEAAEVPAAPELTVPGDETPAGREADDAGRAERKRQRTETEPAPGAGTGGTPATPEPQQPADTPENDMPPPSGSDAEDYERFCEDNPGACSD